MNKEKQTFARNIVRYIGRLEKLRREYLDEQLLPYQLKGSMFMMLLYLDRNPGSSQDQLADFIGIDKSGIARKCRTMDDLGYLLRHQSKENRRQYNLFLTDKGLEVLPIIRTLLSKWSTYITTGMDENEEKELIRLLEKMMDNAIEKVQ